MNKRDLWRSLRLSSRSTSSRPRPPAEGLLLLPSSHASSRSLRTTSSGAGGSGGVSSGVPGEEGRIR